MKEKNLNQNQILLKYIRQKQLKEGGYLTTDTTTYKIFRWCFFVALIVCLALNLFYVLGVSRQLLAHLANMGEIAPHQEIEIQRLKVSLTVVGVSVFFLFLSEVSLWFKLPVLQFVFCFGASSAIIARISANEIYDKTSSTLMGNHIIPLTILCFFCLVSSFIYINQLRKDKIEIKKLSEYIYRKYSSDGTDIDSKQWETILKEYNPYKSESKKRSVKARNKKKDPEKE